jgi:hypothetical protein
VAGTNEVRRGILPSNYVKLIKEFWININYMELFENFVWSAVLSNGSYQAGPFLQ